MDFINNQLGMYDEIYRVPILTYIVFTDAMQRVDSDVMRQMVTGLATEVMATITAYNQLDPEKIVSSGMHIMEQVQNVFGNQAR